LVFLVSIRTNPTAKELAEAFGYPESSGDYFFRIAKLVSEIVVEVVRFRVAFPSRAHAALKAGLLRGAAFFVDTSHTSIKRPGKGKSKDRKRYYYFRGGWALKWQLAVGLDGRIWSAIGVGPFGEISDQRAYAESELPALARKLGMKGIGDSAYSKLPEMYGVKKGKKQSVENAAYNKEIQVIRSFIENVNERLKTWRVLTFWRHGRDALHYFNNCLVTIAGLVNMELDDQFVRPLRVNKRTLRPVVALERNRKKRKLYEEAKDTREQQVPEPEEEPKEEWHEVDCILSHKLLKNNVTKEKEWYYRVRFLNNNGGRKVLLLHENLLTPDVVLPYKKLHGIK
jgi:hypothetical protein